ncbi:eukaryotic translation initiation factor 4G-like isoform X2 [Benincasa hispida]|nr:eukaryotic translation initiation factor 4G-like isoform X2 [Benincasa hispida]XP_038881673.1 eukaryotic translation initiation factor 4G-like isoform X2 [Benincasa hispida]
MQASAGAPLNQNQKPSHVSFVSHRTSISLPDSKSMSLVHHIADSPNVKEVQVHDENSISSAAKHVEMQSLPGSSTQVIYSCPKESLSKSNSIKADNKVSGKKGPIQLLHQVEVSDSICNSKLDSSLQFEQSKHELVGTKKVGARRLPDSQDDIEQSKPPFCMKPTAINNGNSKSKTLEEWDEPIISHAELGSTNDSNVLSSSKTHGCKTSAILVSSCQSDSNTKNHTVVCRADLQSALVETSEPSEMKQKGDRIEHTGGQCDPNFRPFIKDKPVMDINKMRNRSKKKRKEIIRKADAAGTTSDLYMAYKETEEKKETVLSAESSNESINMKHESAGSVKEEAVLTRKDVQGKLEPDDWEDAVDNSTVTLKYEGGFEDKANRKIALRLKDESRDLAKKYSRDFLLKFAEQFMDLPAGFEVTPNIKGLMSINHGSRSVNSNSPANLGKMDKPSGGSRLDHRAITADDRLLASGRHSHLDSTRPTQGANNSAVKSQWAHVGSQGKIQRNGSNTDRWQRDAIFQVKGIISPPTPSQVMHRAEKKYEVGKAADQEETKQRQLKAILNKLTPQNFEKLFEQVKAVNIDSSKTLSGVISQIFDKALMEPTFCEMYANFCLHLAGELPDFSDDHQKITFKRLLLNKCQEEFEKEQEENDEVNKVGEMKQSAEEREVNRTKARRRMLGNIRLIGELYKKKMITEKIMHVCIKKLLGQYQNPDEEDIEALCKLMSTIGEMIDHPKAKDHMNAYFEMMTELSNNMKLSSRVRFMLKDAIDLRKNKWQQRRKVEGPKKIDEVHRDAVQERQAQTSRLTRGPRISPPLRRGTSMDFGSKAPALLPSPNAQIGGFHGFSTQNCGSSSQDPCFKGKLQPSEAKAFPTPLPQRSISDDSVTLGPQGGLARGMFIRGSRSVSSNSLSDLPLPTGNNSQKMVAILSPHGLVSEHATSNSRGDIPSRKFSQGILGSESLDQAMSTQEPAISGLRRCQPTKYEQPALTPNGHCEVMSEDHLRDKSIAAIREYYSARDEKEVTLCIKDLNSPEFHSSMISLWVTDSFERQNTERDLLAKLLVSLIKSKDATLTQLQLLKGIQSVLATLDDAVNDAPKAPQFMGRLLANLMWENLISLKEIGKFIYEGGEEPGSLVQAGIAADVLGNVLEVVQLDKGQIFLNEVLKSSDLQLEIFRPSYPIKSTKLEKFI